MPIVTHLLALNLEVLCTHCQRPFPLSISAREHLLFSVKSRPKRLRIVIRWRDHLSSGEKRAGCADLVTCPSSTFLSVYWRPAVALAPVEGTYIKCIVTVGDACSSA
jgi:hypothetical protein